MGRAHANASTVNEDEPFDLRSLQTASAEFLDSDDPGYIARAASGILMDRLQATRAAVLFAESGKPDELLFLEGERRNGSGSPRFFAEEGWEWTHPTGTGLNMPVRFIAGRDAPGVQLGEAQADWVENLCNIASLCIQKAMLIHACGSISRSLNRKVVELDTLFQASLEFNRLLDRHRIVNLFKFTVTGQLLMRKLVFAHRTGQGGKALVWNGFRNVPPTDKNLSLLFEHAAGGVDEPQPLKVTDPRLLEMGLTKLISIRHSQEAVVGIGDRLDGKPLTDADYRLVESLGTLTLVALERMDLLDERLEKRRMSEELDLARRIQEQLIPNPIPQTPELHVAAINIPSKEVGGDYLDVLKTPDSNLIYAIGDVSGKGVPAALLMASLQAMIHILLPVEITLDDAMGRINELIYQNTPSDKFITFFLGKYHRDTSRFHYVNAGHNAPLLIRDGQEQPIELSQGGMLLGAFPGHLPYETGEIELKSGDVIAMFTDGVTETFSKENEEYGEERLLESLRRNRHLDAHSLMNAILSDAGAFSGSVFHDDVTLLVIKKP